MLKRIFLWCLVAYILFCLFWITSCYYSHFSSDHLGKAKVKATKVTEIQVGERLDRFYVDCGRYPMTEEGLGALIEKPKWCQQWGPEPYMDNLPKDQWKREFTYTSDGQRFKLLSFAADKKTGGDDYDKDIVFEAQGGDGAASSRVKKMPPSAFRVKKMPRSASRVKRAHTATSRLKGEKPIHSAELLAKGKLQNIPGLRWYLASAGSSCLEFCEAKGGYNIKTNTLIGSEGTYRGCVEVALSLGAEGPVTNVLGQSRGCYKNTATGHYYYSISRVREIIYEVRPDYKDANVQRICGCNE